MKKPSKRLTEPVVLFVSVEATQHETLRHLAFRAHRSLADVVRQALTEFLARQTDLPAVDVHARPAPETIGYDTPFHAKREQDASE